MLQKFNHYGNDVEVYDACADPIKESNHAHAVIISLWFLLVNVLYLASAQFDWLNVDAGNKGLYAGYIVAIVAYLAAMRFVPAFRRLSTLPTLVNIVILVSYGIVVSNAAPYMIAFMFFIIMLVIATAYTETMLRMVCILVVSAAVFIYFSYMDKPTSIAYQDISNTIVILGLSLVLHYPFQRIRIHQFVIHNQNRQIHRELEVRSSFDPMTELFERRTFFALSGESLQDPTPFMALCLVDLDGFKHINDQLGHQAGDRAIQLTGRVIAETLGMDAPDKWAYKQAVVQSRGSFAGRLGGDEFILLVRDKTDEQEVHALLDTLLATLNHVEDAEIHGLQASIGMTRILPGEGDVDKAYKRADEALYRSKASGKNRITAG